MELPDVASPPASRTRKVFFQAPGRLRSGWRLALFYVLAGGASACLLLLLRAAHLLPSRGDAGAAVPFRQLPQVAAVLGVVVAVSGGLLRKTDRRGLATLGLPLRPRALPGAFLGILAGGLPVALSVAVFLALGAASLRPFESMPAQPALTGIAAMAVTAMGSGLEEFLWRGYPLQLLIEGTGRQIAVLLTVLLWALGHGGNPGANLVGAAELVLSGALLAWIVIRTGSLWFAIGYHVAWNVVAAHFFGLVTSGFDLGGSLFRTTLKGPAWLTGGPYGFEASIVTGILDVLCLAAALLLSGRLPPCSEALPYFRRRVSRPPVEAGEWAPWSTRTARGGAVTPGIPASSGARPSEGPSGGGAGPDRR